MARGKSGSKSSSGGRNNRTVGLNDIDPSLVPYEEKILHPSEGRPLSGWNVYAKNRVELAEALPYFQISRGSTYMEDDIVRGFLLNDDEDDGAYRGRQGYMDAETVIAKIPAALPWQNTVTGRVHTKTRKRARAGLAVQYDAFYNNLIQNHPLILILDRKWKDSIFDCDDSDQTLETRYLVLDHFLVSNIWQEPSSVPGSGDAFFVRFEKLDLQYASWWITPKITPPPLAQRDFTLLQEIACQQCGTRCAQVYAEDWFCCNPSCVYFGFNELGEEVTSRDLNYHPAFLKQRVSRDRFFAPRYDRQPDLLSLVKSQQQYTMSGKAGNKASADLWRAIVCPNCMLCVPRIFWQAWRCDACKRLYAYEPTGELYQKYSFMQEFGVSQTGHPMVDITCPSDYRIQPPLVRPTYRMDRVFLHGDAFVTLISPTAEFNQSEHGPNDVFNELLSQAPVGQIPLRRRRLYPFDKHSGKRTPYFAAMYGEQYDFSSLASITPEQTPDSVLNAEALLVNATNAEVTKHYKDKFNQASLECYFDNMLMPWHTDGDKELGSTIAMVSLGSKAEVRIRLKQHVYQNSNLSKIIKGSYNWENLAKVKRSVGAGLSVDQAWSQMPLYNGPANPPEVVLPLTHGSIVIFQGKHFSKYFEHIIENADNDSGNLRFTITARHINAIKHAQVKSRHPYARQAGPKFSFIRGVNSHPEADDLPDEGYNSSDSVDSDDSDDDDYHDYSTSRSSDPYWTSKLPSHKYSKKGTSGFPVTGRAEDSIRTARGRPMRAYSDEYDSDSVVPEITAPGPQTGSRRSGRGGGGTGQRGRGGRTGRGSSGRDRSRSPARSSGNSRNVRTRGPTSSVPDALGGLGATATSNAGGGIDPDNVPRSGPAPSRRGKIGGSLPGKKLHWWTDAEMEALRAAGVRVTKGQSTWADEMAGMPAGVTLKNCKERYWRLFKRKENPGS